MTDEEIIEKHLGPSGSCLGSGTLFRAREGYHFMKNQWVVVDGEGLWYGDVDLPRQQEAILAAAVELDRPVELWPGAWGIHPSRGWPDEPFTYSSGRGSLDGPNLIVHP